MNGKRTFPGACILAVVVFVATYANSLHSSFQFDDIHVIRNNLFIRNIGNIPQFFRDASTFSSLPMNATYRPLVTTSLAVDYWLGGGLEPLAFHVTQLAMLAVLGVMLFFFFRKIFDDARPHEWNRYAALLAALLFTVHTANTETANYISARSEIMAAIGIVGAFLVYFHVPQSRRYHLYLLPMVLGALAKTPAVMFAPLLFVYMLLFEKQLSVAQVFASDSRQSVLATMRASLPAFIVGAVTFFAVESMNAHTVDYGGGGRLQYLMTQSFVWVHYAKLFFLPVGLTADTDWGRITQWYDTRVVVGVLFMGTLGYLLWKSSKTHALRPIAFGIAWFVIGLLPSSSVFPLAEVSNEHRVFLPFIGLSFAVVWAIGLALQNQAEVRPYAQRTIGKVSSMGAALVIFGFSVGSYQRNKVWVTEESLWADVSRKSPANGRGLMNYGLTKMKKGEYAEAKQLFEQARVYNPNYATLEINLGIVSNSMGDFPVAEQHFLRALELQPMAAESHYFYAHWLVEQGRSPEAITHLHEAIRLSTATIDSRVLLMNLYFAAGADSALNTVVRSTLAIAADEPTASAYAAGSIPITVIPNDAATLFARGLTYTASNQHLESALLYREAVKLSPENPDIQNNFGWSRAKLGFFEESVPHFEQAIRLRPDYALAKNNLAWVRSQLALKR